MVAFILVELIDSLEYAGFMGRSAILKLFYLTVNE